MANATYAVFLRGINVGGNALLKMAQLKKAFESAGFKNATPVLASGNVVFETPEVELLVLKRRIETMLEKKFGIRAVAIMRRGSQILDLIKSDPFEGAKLPREAKLQVTLLAEETNAGKKFPLELDCKEFKMAQVSRGEVVSVVDLSTKARTPELMNVLEKRFGRNITTRTWNTIEKIAEIVSSAKPA